MISRSRSVRPVALLVVALMALQYAPALAAPVAPRTAAAALQQARQSFAAKDYQGALTIIQRHLKGAPADNASARDLYALLGCCQRRLGDKAAALQSFCKVAQLDPAWAPDPDQYAATDVAAFAEAQQQCKASPGGQPSEGAAPRTPLSVTPPASSPHASSPPPPPPGLSPEGKKKPTALLIGGGLAAGALLFLLLGGKGSSTGAPPSSGGLPGFPGVPGGH